MKKILIAPACAFTLCLTSCASKAAPETKTETQPPQTEIDQPSEEENQTENESDENQAEDSDEDAASAEEETSEDLPLSSEDFPEPEVIEEPEIITLEPVEEPAPEEKEEASEEVKEEEPPVIAEESKPEEKAEETSDDQQNANEENQTEAGEAENTETTGPSDSDDDGITVIGGGIDITDEDTADEKYNEKAEDITPSRSVTLKKLEYLDVTYPGTGWIYMGLVDNSKDIAYFGRKLGTKDTKFSLQARNAGKKIVHFYRNDPLTGNYLDDYLEIIILSENGSNKTHIAAPEYKLPVQKKETKKAAVEEEKVEETDSAEKADIAQTAASTKTSAAAATAAATSTSTKSTSTATTATTNSKPAASTASTSSTSSTTSSTTSTSTESTEETQTMIATTTAVDSATLLEEAQVLYNEKEYSAALKKLNQFFEYSTDKGDEALYLKGQILEAKSDVRDIKGAIDAYTTLTKNYPASKLWDSANKRIIYLKRFYLEVR